MSIIAGYRAPWLLLSWAHNYFIPLLDREWKSILEMWEECFGLIVRAAHLDFLLRPLWQRLKLRRQRQTNVRMRPRIF
jgi:hypothetical protein